MSYIITTTCPVTSDNFVLSAVLGVIVGFILCYSVVRLVVEGKESE